MFDHFWTFDWNDRKIINYIINFSIRLEIFLNFLSVLFQSKRRKLNYFFNFTFVSGRKSNLKPSTDLFLLFSFFIFSSFLSLLFLLHRRRSCSNINFSAGSNSSMRALFFSGEVFAILSGHTYGCEIYWAIFLWAVEFLERDIIPYQSEYVASI